MTARGLIIAAPASGSGKTVVTLGLLRHLARSGHAIASAKAGPDYIDPAFHAAATGRPCINLDLWAMRPETLAGAANGLAANADTVICEGVMGLFDGATAAPGSGSTADIAALSGWPVVLVIDAGAQGASAAAVLRGFATHRTDVAVGGVIFNRVGSPAHAKLVRDAVADSGLGIPVLGCIPRTEGLGLPERHLGLVQAIEHGDLQGFLNRAAAVMAEHIDIEALLNLARRWAGPNATGALLPLAPLGQRIAVARDAAFAFCYPLTLDGWRAAGAEILFFSPLDDQAPDEKADAVYLPGGYPELHASRLCANRNFLGGLRSAAQRGSAIFGECGGYMVLGEGLTDAEGSRHEMAGLLALETSFAERKLHLGYRHAKLSADGPLGIAGGEFRGHEFHYATTLSEGPGDPLFTVTNAAGRQMGACGLRAGTVAGSFLHLIDRA
jgi:cobyrinic acid a,c-diamide synthase